MKIQHRFIFVLISVLVIVGLSGCLPQISFGPSKTEASTQSNNSTSGSTGYATDIQGVQGATIQIESVGTFVDPQIGLTTGAGRGSGFIIDPSGLAVTNNHVVTGAATLKVWVGGDTTKSYNARIVAVSECDDLALIQIEGDGFPYLKWYESPIQVGMDVYSAGYPLGEPEFTLTKGIVSKITKADTSWASVDQVIMHDAKINPGNSGGPLVSQNGEVVGVNYASISSADQNFAIHAEKAQSIVALLKQGKDYESIGVNGSAVVSDDGTLSGIWVSSIKSGSIADKSGLQAGDLITSLEGLPLAKDGTMADYCDILRSHQETDTLSLEVLRYSSMEALSGQLNGRELAVTASASNTSGSSTTAPGDWITITDNTSSIYYQIPSTWQYTDGGSWMSGDENVGISLSAAPDSDAYNNGNGPWIFVGASKKLATQYGYDDFLNANKANVSSSCSYQGREDASGFASLSIAKSDTFYCGDIVLIAIAGVPKSQSFLVFGEVQIYSQADWDLYTSLLSTVVTGY